MEKIERKFRCEFIQAEVSISGYAVTRERQVDFCSGKMDAVAFRGGEKDVLEVFVVDWKTTTKTDLLDLYQWWEKAEYFKKPLYQCLVYRELWQAHLKHNNVKAKVGIILVPIHQTYPELSYPGLCMDFKTMSDTRLLDKLKDFQWLLDYSHSCSSRYSRCVTVVDITGYVLYGDCSLGYFFIIKNIVKR